MHAAAAAAAAVLFLVMLTGQSQAFVAGICTTISRTGCTTISRTGSSMGSRKGTGHHSLVQSESSSQHSKLERESDQEREQQGGGRSNFQSY